jgi:4-diphosphocytidyl-2-C-methyl-D-erythritol kinase
MADMEASICAQAKVNLFLRVGAREPDGYHDIQTLFQRIELGDDVVVRVLYEAKRSIDCRGMDTGPAERNLAFRAAQLFAEVAGWPRGFEIEIDKRIPVGGGLGGGSADAAAVLRVLNQLSPNPIDATAMNQLAAGLGADVAFLASDSCLSFGEGRGDILRAIDPLPVRGVTLFQMPFGVNTATAYAWLDSDRDRESQPPRVSRSFPILESWDDVALLAENDFESVVSDRYPEIAVLLAMVRSADYALAEMTGSGSTVFALSHGAEPEAAPDFVGGFSEEIPTRTASAVAKVQFLNG